MKCSWCNHETELFELVIYYLRKETTNIANHRDGIIQYIRNGQYVAVKICEKCLPVTSTKNLERYKLRGNEQSR